MKFLPKTSRIKVGLVLSLIMTVVILIELALAYKYLYPNLNVADDMVKTKDIVRVDLKAYDQTINLLDRLETYQPDPLVLPRPNPFK